MSQRQTKKTGDWSVKEHQKIATALKTFHSQDKKKKLVPLFRYIILFDNLLVPSCQLT